MSLSRRWFLGGLAAAPVVVPLATVAADKPRVTASKAALEYAAAFEEHIPYLRPPAVYALRNKDGKLVGHEVCEGGKVEHPDLGPLCGDYIAERIV